MVLAYAHRIAYKPGILLSAAKQNLVNWWCGGVGADQVVYTLKTCVHAQASPGSTKPQLEWC